jgi:hypothetical protein
MITPPTSGRELVRAYAHQVVRRHERPLPSVDAYDDLLGKASS